MAQVVAPTAPGAAAALLDTAGTETSRLRAFGIVHGHLLGALGVAEHAWLLDLLDGRGRREVADIGNPHLEPLLTLAVTR
jgi:hypothetical protein